MLLDCTRVLGGKPISSIGLGKVDLLVADGLQRHVRIIERTIERCGDDIAKACGLIVETICRGGKIITAGNGGSASQADHISGEFVGRFSVDRRPYPAFSLTHGIAALTAIANDYSYEEIFDRQLRAYGQPGDLLISLTTSGRSRNILRLLAAAKRIGIATVTLTGLDQSEVEGHSDVVVSVPSDEVARIQEVHLLVGHLFAQIGEAQIIGMTE